MVCKKKGNKHFQKSTVGSLFADSFKLKYIFVFNGLGSFKIWKLFLNYLTCMLLYSIIYYYLLLLHEIKDDYFWSKFMVQPESVTKILGSF